jgi:hypothetical protein
MPRKPPKDIITYATWPEYLSTMELGLADALALSVIHGGAFNLIGGDQSVRLIGGEGTGSCASHGTLHLDNGADAAGSHLTARVIASAR